MQDNLWCRITRGAIHSVEQYIPWSAKSPSVADARAVRPYMQEATPNEVAKAVSTVMIN